MSRNWLAAQELPLCIAGMCTIEGNTGTIRAATGTTPNTDTTGCSRLRPTISQALL